MSINATTKLDHEKYIRDIADSLSAHIHNKLMNLTHNCTTCEHFAAEDICSLFKARPPASVIIKGCDKYKEDEIPF